MEEKTDAFVTSTEGVEPVKNPPNHLETRNWDLIAPKTGGPESVELTVGEIGPSGRVLEHEHAGRDYIFYVLSGHALAKVEDDSFELDPGRTLFIPEGLSHFLKVTAEEIFRMIVITAPARKE